MYPGDEMIVELILIILDVSALYLITIGSHKKTLQTCFSKADQANIPNINDTEAQPTG